MPAGKLSRVPRGLCVRRHARGRPSLPVGESVPDERALLGLGRVADARVVHGRVPPERHVARDRDRRHEGREQLDLLPRHGFVGLRQLRHPAFHCRCVDHAEDRSRRAGRGRGDEDAGDGESRESRGDSQLLHGCYLSFFDSPIPPHPAAGEQIKGRFNEPPLDELLP